MTKRLYEVHFIKFMTYSLDARSIGGNVENTRYENSICRLLIHYHTLLLPIHDLKKRWGGWACNFFYCKIMKMVSFNVQPLGHIILKLQKTIHYIVLFRSIERDLFTLLYIFFVHVMCISNRKILKYSYPDNIKSKLYTVCNALHTCQARTTLMLFNTTFNNISVITYNGGQFY